MTIRAFGQRPLAYAAALTAAALLAACGGGGGRPGECFGGPQVCAVAPSTGQTPTPPDSDATCADFAYQDEAQAAYLAGAYRLDGDNDGVACEHLPKRPST